VEPRCKDYKIALAVLAVAFSLVPAIAASSAHGYEPRVPQGYFGVSAPETVELARNSEIARLDRHVAAMKAAGIDWARVTFDWRLSEPLVPVAGAHAYDWTWTDRLVAAYARQGITLVPNPVGAPIWARSLDATLAGCTTSAAIAPERASAFGAYAESIVRRYGRNGAFWGQNPSLPYRPVRAIEVWNEPNWHGSWCPRPEPEAVAPLLTAAASGIERADPQAEVVLGGLATIKVDTRFSDGRLKGMAADTFLERLLAAEPDLAQQIDTVGIHLYESDPTESLSLLGWLRRTLTSVGLGQADLLVTEFGWSTVGSGSVSEAERAENFEDLLRVLPRTDCGLSGIAPHTWFSFELNATDPEHWFGIANPQSGNPYPTGQAFARMISLWGGRGDSPPPRDLLPVCNAGPPDQDGDGWADEVDDYPFDPTRHDGANEPPPPPDAPPREERTMPPSVDDEFFGVTDAWLPEEGPLRQAHYDAMGAAGFGVVRQQLIWRNLEPQPGTYEWAETDRRALALARRGIRMAPVMINAPASIAPGGPAADGPYANLMSSLAARYGSQGSYWDENGHLDRNLAVRDYEVWQAGNASWGAWDGTPSPAEYARTYATARAAIRGEDPGGRVIASLVDWADGLSAGEFLRRMVAADPALGGQIDGVYVMAKDARSAAEAEATAANVRMALEATGNGSAKLYVGFGAWTQGEGAISESARASLIGEIASALPRSDCGVDGAYAFAWATRSEDPSNSYDWYGIASLADASLTPTGAALKGIVRSFRGYGAVVPPRAASHGCFRQALDRDRDGAQDPVDSHPLDSSQRGTAPSPPPAPTFTAAPSEWSAVRDASLSYSASRATTYQCRFDGGGWQSCGSTFTKGQLADGRHSLVVRGLDALGIVGPESERHWNVDTRSPSVSIEAGPNALVLSDSATFTVSSDEPGSFRCQIDTGLWRDCGASERIQGLTDGNHVFRVNAVDRAGNVSGSYAARGFETRTIPRTPSILSITGSPGQSPRATFDAAFAVRYECRYDEAAFAPCSELKADVPSEPLSHGSHRFYVRGIGGTGVAGPAVSAPVQVVDSRDPETEIGGGPQGVSLADQVTFRVSSDEPHVAIHCQLDQRGWEPCNSDLVLTGLSDGSHTLRARATDSAGNYDRTPAERSFEVQTVPGLPELTAGPGEGGETGTLPRLSFTVPFAATAQCRFDAEEFRLCAAPTWHEPTDPLAAGAHTFEVRGIGGTGKVGSSAVRSFVVAATAKSCRGLAVTLTGTPGNDTLRGTSGPDVIFADGGSDVVSSGGGNDVICGGGGADRIAGGAGADFLLGGSGSDQCRGGAGQNRLKSCER
jgi:hypothetical protein